MNRSGKDLSKFENSKYLGRIISRIRSAIGRSKNSVHKSFRWVKGSGSRNRCERIPPRNDLGQAENSIIFLLFRFFLG